MSAPLIRGLIPGAEPWSHIADRPGAPGALVIHGFTSNPMSMRGVADAFAVAGFHVELPRLPGHGTVMDDMLDTRWADWTGEAEAAFHRLTARTDVRNIVVVGLSMGGSLTFRVGADHPQVAGLVCVNPLAQSQPVEVIALLESMLGEGTTVMPGIGSDIADPDITESAYPGTPIAALLSLLTDGVAPLAEGYADMMVPLLLFTSPQDHVVDPAQSDFLAQHYGGTVERVPLPRSFHVATQDLDKDLIFQRSVEFAIRVTGAAASR